MEKVSGQAKISADTFSYLYGKLESLDVQTIVDSMLHVPELRNALQQKLHLVANEGRNGQVKIEDPDFAEQSLYCTSAQRLTPPGSIPTSPAILSQLSRSPFTKMPPLNTSLLSTGMLDYLTASQIMNHQYQQLLSQTLLIGSWKSSSPADRVETVTRNKSHSPSSHSTSVPNSPAMEEGSDACSDPQEVPCPECHTSVSLTEIHDHVENWCQKRYRVTQRNRQLESSFLDVTNLDYKNIKSSPHDEHHNKLERTQRRSPRPAWRCEQCDLDFKNKSDLKRHKITHTHGGGFICETCSKPFAKVELLRRHEQQIHSEANRQPWPCPDCLKTFSNKYNLAVHQRIHTGELPFACPYCSERFRVKCSMQNHMRSKHAVVVADFDDDLPDQI